ncbi:hypothetical protein ACTFIV_004175 [Dictyostelium citrinum]
MRALSRANGSSDAYSRSTLTSTTFEFLKLQIISNRPKLYHFSFTKFINTTTNGKINYQYLIKVNKTKYSSHFSRNVHLLSCKVKISNNVMNISQHFEVAMVLELDLVIQEWKCDNDKVVKFQKISIPCWSSGEDFRLDNPSIDSTLSYSSLLMKWIKLATLEYFKKAKELKIVSAKDHNNFKDPKILLTLTTKPRKTTAKYYCIPESSLPNLISFDQFI